MQTPLTRGRGYTKACLDVIGRISIFPNLLYANSFYQTDPISVVVIYEINHFGHKRMIIVALDFSQEAILKGRRSSFMRQKASPKPLAFYIA